MREIKKIICLLRIPETLDYVQRNFIVSNSKEFLAYRCVSQNTQIYLKYLSVTST